MTMRITAIYERAVPVQSSMRNAAFDFSEMTTSVVAVVTDAVRNGRPVVRRCGSALSRGC